MRVYETVVYGDDLGAMAGFYADVLGLRLVDADELVLAFRLDGGALLLVFDPAVSSAAGRRVPSHGAPGAGHVAFAVEPGELDWWKDRFRDAGVPIEQEIEWGGDRGRSLYVRDPAGNSVELVDGDMWPR